MSDSWVAIDGDDDDLVLEEDRSKVDALWNPFVAAWFEGKDDPKLQLIRLDAESATIWLNDSSLFAGIKMALGVSDPKQDYKDKVADVALN